MNKSVLLSFLLLFGLTAAAAYSVRLYQRYTASEAESTTPIATIPKSDSADESAAAVAVRPLPVDNSESISKLADQLRARLETEKERETRLNERQESLRLIYDDIRNEQEEIDKKRKQLDDQLKVAVKAIQEDQKTVEQQRTEVKLKEMQLQSEATAKPTGDLTLEEGPIFRRLGSVFDTMPPDRASGIFVQLGKDGNFDTVVKLLAVMKERQASKVLSELQTADPVMAAQLTEKLQSVKRTKAAPK